MGNITIQGDLTGGIPGGAVGGGNNLTTVGAIPYVSSAGVLNQDATKLFWDATNKRLGVGTNAPASILSLQGSNPILGLYASANVTGQGSVQWFLNNQTKKWGVGMNEYATLDLEVYDGSGLAAVFKNSSRNLIIGSTTTDLGYGLHAANKGTNGNLLVFDPTATTGTTKAVFAAGQGQSGNILEVRDYNATPGSGALRTYISSAGYLYAPYFASGTSVVLQTAAQAVTLANASTLSWVSISDATSGTRDTSLSRASAGVVQVGDGGANANGYLSAARIGVGTASPADDIEISKAATPTLRLNRTTTSSYGQVLFYESGSFSGAVYSIGSTFATVSRRNALEINSNSGPVSFAPSGTEAGRFAATTGNLLLGTTTDLGYGLHAANKGTNGNLLVFDPTATTGTTKAVVRAGAGQSGNIFEVQNSAGAALASIASTGFVSTPQVYLTGDWLNLTSTTADMASGYLLRFSSMAAQGGTKDLSLSRASAGVLQVGDGGANANGYLSAARIGVGTTSPGAFIDIAASSATAGLRVINGSLNQNPQVRVEGYATVKMQSMNPASDARASIGTESNNTLEFIVNNSGVARFAATSGNLLIGTTTDLGYGLHAANKGTNGNLLVFDPTATTGTTKAVFAAGQGQSGNLLETRLYNATPGSGLLRTYIDSSGYLFSPYFAVTTYFVAQANDAAVTLRNSGQVTWVSNADATSGTRDTSLSRASAGVLQVGDGGANSNGAILAKTHTWAAGTEGTCNSTNRGQVVMVQSGAGVADTLRVCRKDAADAYAWTALY